MNNNIKRVGILFSRADIVSIEDICLIKKSLIDNLVDEIIFVPTPVLNFGSETYVCNRYNQLKTYNKEIFSLIPQVRLWNKELDLFDTAKQCTFYHNDYLELISRLNKQRMPEDVLLDIVVSIKEEYSKDDSIEIKLLANSTIIYNHGYEMWEKFGFLIDNMILDDAYTISTSDSFNRSVLKKFEDKIVTLNMFEYLSKLNLSAEDFESTNFDLPIQKKIENIKSLVEFLNEDDENSSINKKQPMTPITTIEVLFEENNAFVVELTEENELIPLTYSYCAAETGETINQAINKVVKAFTGFDIDGKYAELLYKNMDENENLEIICYLDSTKIPSIDTKYDSKNIAAVNVAGIRRISINNTIEKTINNSYKHVGHISTVLKKAVDSLRCKLKEKKAESTKSTSDIVTEKDAITTYQWNIGDNLFDFLNTAKLVISVTYNGFSNQKGKTII